VNETWGTIWDETAAGSTFDADRVAALRETQMADDDETWDTIWDVTQINKTLRDYTQVYEDDNGGSMIR
jgi:hypothetical protein